MPEHLDRSRTSTGPLAGAKVHPENDPDRADARPPSPGTTLGATQSSTPVRAVRQGSLSRAAWSALIVGLIVLILLLVFILQNNTATRFRFWSGRFTLPLGVAMLFAAIAGALIAVMVGTVRMVVLGRRVRNLERQRDSSQG